MNKLKNLFVFIIACVISLLILEISLSALVNFNFINIHKTSYSLYNALNPFRTDLNPYFGVWRPPNSRYRHVKSCFDVEYTANSYGARDKERNIVSSKKRVIMLGDSFIEGFGVELDQRLSNLLENNTGIEHLNFGIGGNFGTAQYYLLYKYLAKKFDHNAIIIGVLPENDFRDNDYEFGKRFYTNQYRPYFIGKYPKYTIKYFKNKIKTYSGFSKIFKDFRSILREFLYSYNALVYASEIILYNNAIKNNSQPADSNMVDKIYSGYYDYKESQFNVMKYTFELILKEAMGRKMIIFTIPVLNDLKRYKVNGPSPLSLELENFSKKNNIIYIDLLSIIFKNENDWENYFLLCDSHWSQYGNFKVFKIIQHELSIYNNWKD